MAKFPVYGKKTVLTYVFLKSAAKNHLATAESIEDGQLYSCMSSLVFSAFTLEAYLNHIGTELFHDWENFERDYSPRGKLDLICNKLELAPDFSALPYQSFDRVFKLRNLLAHGRTTEVSGSWKEHPAYEKKTIQLDSDWQKECVPTIARRVYDDMVAIVNQIHKQAGHGDPPFTIASHGFAIKGE